MQQRHVISCDWGTSSLRLQLIDTVSRSCLARVSSPHGNAAIYNEWRVRPGSDRVLFYVKYLKPLLDQLSTSSGVAVGGLAILISGMASSSVGMKELPYAELPFNVDGSSANAEWIEVKDVINNPVFLISGVQQADDVMRGEETQLVGIASLFKLPEREDLLFILPGTHSKHVAVIGHRIVHFKTFMTGEIFDTLTKHTVLSHAVADPKNEGFSDEVSGPFKQGVLKALNTELLNSLFSVRINQLKKNLSPERNYYYLSGLLIGSELKYMVENNQKLVLCSSGRLLQLYQLALDIAGVSHRSVVVPAEILDNAAAEGQLKMLSNIKFT